jgi:UPF0288 family protein (methanogenesis marker protein 3)
MIGEKTNNITVDEDGKYVSIRVNPRLYKVHVIMRAADNLLHEMENQIEAVIDGDPEKEMVVKFIPNARLDREKLLKLAYRFNTLLVSASGKG